MKKFIVKAISTILLVCLVVCLAFVFPGCGTVRAFKYRSSDTVPKDRYPMLYPAVCYDLDFYAWIFNTGHYHREGMDNLIHGIGWFPCLIGTTIDLPFSIVSDTLCLPYDIYRKQESKNE